MQIRYQQKKQHFKNLQPSSSTTEDPSDPSSCSTLGLYDLFLWGNQVCDAPMPFSVEPSESSEISIVSGSICAWTIMNRRRFWYNPLLHFVPGGGCPESGLGVRPWRCCQLTTRKSNLARESTMLLADLWQQFHCFYPSRHKIPRHGSSLL